MNNIKNRFSIKDLENLTGIKAHTIRIWEKRYNLLTPNRTETNIRFYDLASFQKLLNVSYLNNNGFKISKIATIADNDIPRLVKEIAIENNQESHIINDFKLAMLNFDQQLFYKTYDTLHSDKSFEDIFYDIFIPLLSQIGVLWQTNTITPAHEHFISGLIRQKIIMNTGIVQSKQNPSSNKTFVLYLPDNEMHELGLMFLNYKLISKGHHSILLGQSIPLDSLSDLQHYYDNITYISYFTIKPDVENVISYLNECDDIIMKTPNTNFWVLGQMISAIDSDKIPNKIKTFNSIKDLTNAL